MNNFITYLFIIFMVIFGGFSTLYVVVSLPVTLMYPRTSHRINRIEGCSLVMIYLVYIGYAICRCQV